MTSMTPMAQLISSWTDRLRGALSMERAATESDTSIAGGALLWNERDSLTIDVNWKEELPTHGRYSHLVPQTRINLSQGRGILISQDGVISRFINNDITRRRQTWCPPVAIVAADGQSEILKDAPSILTAWRAIVARRIAQDVGRADMADAVHPSINASLEDVLVDCIMSQAPTACDEIYKVQPTIGFYKGERPADPPLRDQKTQWLRLNGDILLQVLQTQYLQKGRRYIDLGQNAVSMAFVSHPDLGIVGVEGTKVVQAMEARRRMSIAGAFGSGVPMQTPILTGNATAARVIELAQRALALDPDLADERGTRIAPLIEEHVPRLLNTHARAARNATAQELTTIDEELQQGLEIVRQAVEQALTTKHDQQRDALRIELSFLRSRHPDTSF